MLGMNAVALVFFGCINVAAYQLCKCPESRRRKVIFPLCAVLLGGNLLRYGVVYPFLKGAVLLPVEFSTVAYFAVPTILLASKKRLHSWAAYSGLMAGFFYYMAMIAAGGLMAQVSQAGLQEQAASGTMPEAACFGSTIILSAS